MRLLDLFCGAGGAAVGYHRAGFDQIVGVDIARQDSYPFLFVQGDALRPPFDLAAFDLIHASPPCQAHSTLRYSPGAGEYSDLVDATRDMLRRSGVPYVIENVPGAPLRNPVTLCGSSLGCRSTVYELRRHRLFESSFPLLVPSCDHRLPVLGVYGDLARKPRKSTRGVKAGVIEAEVLMGIDWMTPRELVQAIPPVYTQYIGQQFIAQTVRG